MLAINDYLVRDQTGACTNPQQTNCPSAAACSHAAGCTCPRDLNGDIGVMINQFTGYQCAYPHGACTWDYVSFSIQGTDFCNLNYVSYLDWEPTEHSTV